MSTSREFLRPSGRLGRNVRLGFSTSLIALGSGLSTLIPGLSGQVGALVVVGVVVIGACIWLWIRAAFVRISISGDTLIVRSWWSTMKIDRRRIRIVRAQTYGGFFYIVGWPVPSGVLESGELVIEKVDGTEATLRGTVTSFLTAKRQAAELNDWLGVEVGPRRAARDRHRRRR